MEPVTSRDTGGSSRAGQRTRQRLPVARLGVPAGNPYRGEMSNQRLPYDDAASPTEMTRDCQVVVDALPLPEDYPREVAKPRIEVSEAAARLAAAFHLPRA